MPLFIPPLVAVTVGAVGAVALARLAVRHVDRINERLDVLREAARDRAAAEGPQGGPVTRLRRNPETGDYSPE